MEGPPSGVQELCSVALYGDKTYPNLRSKLMEGPPSEAQGFSPWCLTAIRPIPICEAN